MARFDSWSCLIDPAIPTQSGQTILPEAQRGTQAKAPCRRAAYICWMGAVVLKAKNTGIGDLNPPYANLSAIFKWHFVSPAAAILKEVFLLRNFPPLTVFAYGVTALSLSISMWRWIIFFIFVDVWPFLSLPRGLYAYNILKPVWRKASSEADSGSFRATDVDGASNAAAFSSPKKDREMAGEVKVDSYQLFAPRSRKRLNKGWFLWAWLFQQLGGRPRPSFTFCQRKRKWKSSLRAREAFGRHGAGCVTSFSVTRSRPRVRQSEAPPGGGLAWVCIE